MILLLIIVLFKILLLDVFLAKVFLNPIPLSVLPVLLGVFLALLLKCVRNASVVITFILINSATRHVSQDIS